MSRRRDALFALILAAAVPAAASADNFAPQTDVPGAPAAPITPVADGNAPLLVTTSFLKGASLRLYGFVEADSIYDTTQSLTEEPDNNLIQRRTVAPGSGGASTANNIAGQRGREEMSVRNSRLGGEITIPTTDSGWKTKGIFEIDFLGNQGVTTAPGTTPGTQTENNFFNNPALRVRHAYVDLTKGELNYKIGQTWSLFGWQPYYFPGETGVLPTPGMLYRRFAQGRVTDTHRIADGWNLETAADAAKPAEMNSGSPEWQGGVRVVSTKITGASINGAYTSMVGLSAALSGVLVPTRTTNIGNPTGQGAAFDFFIPIIPSSDGKSRDNTLVLGGEAGAGTGIGGLEYAGLSLGVPGLGATAPGADGGIDPGIGGVNSAGDFQLLQVRAFRAHLQYSLKQWATSFGYSQVEARNLSAFSSLLTNNAAQNLALVNGLAPKIQYGYVSVMYDPLDWLRFSAEVSQTRDTYNDANNRYAANNRYELSAYFKF